MRIGYGTALLCLGLVTCASYAQSEKDAEKALRASLMNQPLCLLSFSAQSEVDAHWDGTEVVVDKPYVAMLAAIVVKA
jgi:hypothetical protein